MNAPSLETLADWKRLGPMHQAKAAYWENKEAADAGDSLFRSWVSPRLFYEFMPPAVRIAVRIAAGRTIEESAAGEYLYRWHLALQSPVFGVPHSLGL